MGNKVGHCKQEVKGFVHVKAVFVLLSIKHGILHCAIKSLEPLQTAVLQSFQSFASTVYAGKRCSVAVLPFQAIDPAVEDNVNTNATMRQVTPQDKETLTVPHVRFYVTREVKALPLMKAHVMISLCS